MFITAIEVTVGVYRLLMPQPAVTNKVASFAGKYWPFIFIGGSILMGAALYTLDQTDASN